MAPLFETFPVEILERIFADNNLTCTDIIHLSTVCKLCYTVSQSNVIWNRQFFHRWPALWRLHDRIDSKSQNWKNLFKDCFQCQRLIPGELHDLLIKYWTKDFLSNNVFHRYLSLAHKYGIDTVIELLRQISTNEKESTLTEQYYAAKALKVVIHRQLETKWKEFVSHPAEEQLLETGAVMIAQWFQPSVLVSEQLVCSELDSIAQQVRAQLLRSGHTALAAPLPNNTRELAESLWRPADCLVIFRALNDVLFKQLGYRGNSQGYYNVDNSFINKVLLHRTGIPITMAIVYVAVARRLGVLCLPVNCPSHFLLKWKQRPGDPSGNEFTYIDVFNGGVFLPIQTAHRTPASPSPPPSVVFKRMLLNLHNIARHHSQSRNAVTLFLDTLQLTVIVDPDDMHCKMALIDMYRQQDINEDQVQELLSGIGAAERQEWGIPDRSAHVPAMQVKRRSENSQVEYSVGQVMRHQRYNYMCVVYGWDSVCSADEQWITDMGVRSLTYGEYQPFYHVLVDDGSNRYAAQENLSPASHPSEINHPDIGRYFDSFLHGRYQPNCALHAAYPEDTCS